MKRGTPTLLWLGVFGAVSFVGMRVAYRIVFGGASSGETVLWSVGPYPMPGIFRSISLLGTVTLEGLGQAIVGALPFSAVILISAVLLSLWDPRALALSPRGSALLGSTRLALAMALQTLPELVRTYQRLRLAHQWRGIRARWRLALPLFERTVETALGLAGAVWSRGLLEPLARAGYEAPSPRAIRVRGLTVPARGLRGLSVDLSPSRIHVVTGPTGSGKTTLLEALAGLAEVVWREEVAGEVDTGLSPSDIAFLPHRPAQLFVRESVIEDCVATLRQRGMPRSHALVDARKALEDAGLGSLAHRDPLTLSAGEQTKAALVLLMLTRPRLLIADEPLSALDRHQREWFRNALTQGVREGQITVVVSDHHPSRWLGEVTLWQMKRGTLWPGAWTEDPIVAVETPNPPLPVSSPRPEGDGVLEVTGLELRVGGRDLCPPVSCAIGRGETVLVTGDNGVGKTTLLRALVDVQERGLVRCGGVDVADIPRRRRTSFLAVVPDDPSDFFVTESVADELALADRLWGVAPGTTALTLRSLVPSVDETLFLRASDLHPRDLSRGQATALAVSLQVVAQPLAIVVDEPTRGLDAPSRRAVREVVGCLVETGMAVVVISHDDDVADWPVDRHLRLDSSGLHEISRERVG